MKLIRVCTICTFNKQQYKLVFFCVQNELCRYYFDFGFYVCVSLHMKTEIAMLASVSYWIDYFLPESTHAVLDCSIKQIVYQA